MSAAAQGLAALRSALGDEALEEHAPVDLDGAKLAATLRPADGAALARGLAALGEAGLSAVVRGGGNRLGLGNPPRGATLFLSTRGLAGVDEFEPAEGVCHVRAGTTLAEARAAVEPHGWQLPLDAPGEGGTVGGSIAAGAVGPRVHGFGPPRDAVLGLEVALASGERTRCGGRVVKNVTGYDLNKLYAGSLGTLGVIEAAWLRLRPAPEVTRSYRTGAADFRRACEAALAAARRTSTRAALLRAAARGEAEIAVELAGDGASVARDAAWLEAELAAREAQGALDVPPPGEGLHFRLSSLASRLEPTLAALRAAGASVCAHPGPGLIDAAFPRPADGDERAVEAAFAAVARASGGSFVCISAPGWAKRGRDVFGAPPSRLALFRALKQRFDPGGVLNPGRFAGGL